MIGMGMKIPVQERALKVLKNPMMLKLYTAECKAHELPKNLDTACKASVLWDIAELHHAEKDFSKAFSCAREAFSMDNQQAHKVIYKLGIYTAWVGDTDTASSSINRSIELYRTNSNIGDNEHNWKITKQDISKFLLFLTAGEKSVEQQAIDEVERMVADVEQLEEAQDHNFLVYTKDQLRRAYEKMKNPSYCLSLVWILNMVKLKEIIYWFKDLSTLYKKNDANKKKHSELNQSRQSIKSSREILSVIVAGLFIISYLMTAVLFASAKIWSSTFELSDILVKIGLLWFIFPIEFIDALVFGRDLFLWRFIMGYVTILLFLLSGGVYLIESIKEDAKKKAKSDLENKIMYAERELKNIKDEIKKREHRIKKQLSDIIGE
jgi:hypothetical protein